jgi:hypothetical protein
VEKEFHQIGITKGVSYTWPHEWLPEGFFSKQWKQNLSFCTHQWIQLAFVITSYDMKTKEIKSAIKPLGE